MAAGTTGAAAGLIGRSAQAAARSATVSVDLGASRGAFPFGLGRQLGATPKSWKYGPATTEALDGLRLERARVWLQYKDMAAVPGATRYDADYAYLDYYHRRAASLFLNWQTGYDLYAARPGFDHEAFVAAQTEAIAHYKARYPNITHIEAENENIDGAKPDVPGYYRKYVVLYRAVNAVNAEIAAGRLPGPPLLIGGPVNDIYTVWRTEKFLAAYVADPRPDKRLDFISYHQYLTPSGGGSWDAIKDNPAVVAGERAGIDDMLAKKKLPTGLPVFVSEIGVFPGTRQSTLGFEPDLHIQAAAVASLHYWYAGQPGMVPFDWTIDHDINDRKSLFVDTDTGVPRPYFNAVRMLSMLPGTRYAATSDSLSARGLGVYGLAGASPNEVAVMTWNYQWTNQTAYDSRVVLKNFPAAFRTRDVRVTRYRIASTVHEGPLTPVESFLIPPRIQNQYVGQSLRLEPNELRLLVLTPQP